MPRLTTLTATQIKVCDNTLRSRGLIAPNSAILMAIIMTQPRLVSNLRYYRDCGPDATLDTYERDYLMDAVADVYCKEPWPCYNDGNEHMERFSETLVERASEVGWVFTDPS